MTRTMVVAGTLCVSSALAAVAAQDPQQPIFRAGIDVIQLDVSVLDAHRQPVHGLAAADFQVFEDGKPQRIAAVSEIERPDIYAAPPVWARAVHPDVETNALGDRRLFAIVIDDASCCAVNLPRELAGSPMAHELEHGQAQLMLNAAHEVINRLEPGDMASVVFTRQNLQHEGFTDDRDKLHAMVESYVPRDQLPIVLVPPQSRLPQHIRHYPGLETVRDVAEYLARVPLRRKALIYISRGQVYDIRNFPHEALDAIQIAQQANVNVYPIDYEGFMQIPQSIFLDPKDMLRVLADNTGGMTLLDPGKFEKDLDQLFLENGSYYIVGYQTSRPEPDGKYRRLDVKLLGHSNTTVRVRSTVLRAKPDHADGTSNGERLSAGLSPELRDLMPGMDVEFHANAVPMPVPGRAAAPVAIVTGIAELVVPGTPRVVETMTVEATAYDERGDIRGSVRQAARVDATPGEGNMIRYDVLSTLDLAPGRYSLRVVAHNGDNAKVGSVEFAVAIPDVMREPVSLSGIAVASTDAPPALPGAKVFDAILPLVPTATRDFLRSSHATAFLRVFRDARAQAPVALTVHILDSRGATVLDDSQTLAGDRFDANGAATYQRVLPLDTLEPGVYLLSVSAAVGGRTTPQRDVTFRVR
jgi:VWFA-related protein